MNNYGQQLATKIDAEYEASEAEDGMRRHLGASVVGDKCMRAIWFAFRWADSEAWKGRMLRLVDRGQREEEVFADLLRRQGATIWQLDPATGKQFTVSAHGGHFGGSTDGFAIGLPNFPNEPVLLEVKTHNLRLFTLLKQGGVATAKPEHYKQAQAYMHGMNLKGWPVRQCLYCAVCKNDDELYFELFAYDPALGAQLFDRAEAIIFAPGLPPRISETPAWFECKFCAMSSVCFKTKAARINCRTCQFSKPERDGTWSCAKGRSEIVETPKLGCREYVVMEELKL